MVARDRVHDIHRKCSVYKVSDKMIIDDPKIVLEKRTLCASMCYLCYYIMYISENYVLFYGRG